MDTLKQFVEKLKSKINAAIEEGDVFKANEIAANMLSGQVILTMIVLSLLCLILNEFGIFTAEIKTMRYTIIVSNLVAIPIMLLMRQNHGEPAYMKTTIACGIIAICGFLFSTLGHNAALVMIIPVVVSVRYCDSVFTKKICFISAGVAALACLGNAYFGIVNLNIYSPISGTVIEVGKNLRSSIDFTNFDRFGYFKKLIINDYLPKLLAFGVIGFASVQIAERGKEMTDLQDQITQKTARLETELNLATEIQASMLPCIFPAFPDHGEIDLFAINQPAKEVGGDFYDYFVIDGDHIAIVMADVSGKGVGAALFMTISKIVLKNQLMSTLDPALAMTNANKQLCENNDAELFVTVWAGIYEISTRTLTYANAGHNPPIITRKHQLSEYLQGKKGFVLAGFESSKYYNNTIEINPGDQIFLYTDGVTEAQDVDKKLFGEDRLLELINNEVEEDISTQIWDVLAVVYKYMEGTDQFDDITVLAMRIKEKEEDK